MGKDLWLGEVQWLVQGHMWVMAEPGLESGASEDASLVHFQQEQALSLNTL